jgi:midasin
MATSQCLERIISVLDSCKNNSCISKNNSSIWLLEKGDLNPITIHPSFRLFACMNPPGDTGKKQLPSILVFA